MKILVAPLDWGLGHATRTIPIIYQFLSRGWKVDLAVSGRVAALYKGQFPNLEQIPVPGYRIEYPRRGFEMPLWLLKNSTRLMSVILREQKVAQKLVQERGYDAIFSDNRFGFHAEGAYNIYMTHQLSIAFPGPFKALEKIGVAWHKREMSRFDTIWVPDFSEYPGMAGKLSHVPKAKAEYVGALSRFADMDFLNMHWEKKYRYIAILSGPEPMRSSFEKALLKAFEKIPGEHVIIRGFPGDAALPKAPSNVKLFNHLETVEFARTVQSAEYCISRPGYSTVMDMIYLGANCIFVPTPGQTEQLYLGKTLHSARKAGLLKQDEISAKTLTAAMREKHRSWDFNASGNLLSQAIDRLESKLSSTV